MNRLIDHMYIATEGTGQRKAKIKLADPVQVKRILAKHKMQNDIGYAQQTNLSFQPTESGSQRYKAEASPKLLTEQASQQATPTPAVLEHDHLGKQGISNGF